MEDFIRAKAMMTPGVAGASTTMMTGTLVQVFGIPGDITALALSFLLGLLVWADTGVPVVQRVVFYLINSITIFSVAVGLNQAGIVITHKEQPAQVERRAVEPVETDEHFFQSWF